MGCRDGCSKCSTNGMAEKSLETLAFIVTVNSGTGFGYAMGQIPAGVHLDYFCRVGKEPVLSQFMHVAPLCSESTSAIVSDRKESDTNPSTIQN